MAQILQFGNHTITSAEILDRLAEYLLLPQLCRFLLVDAAIAGITLTRSERYSAIAQFYQKHQLTTPDEQQAWLQQNGLTIQLLEAVATRELKIELFKQATWESKLESIFLNHKSQFDKVIYSLIRTQEMEVAQELYFRIRAGEQSFADCAKAYSQGAEAQTGGLLGPIPLSQPHPALAQKLAISQPGQLWPPMRLENWVVIVRLDKLIPAQLDHAMRSTLLNHLFETWLNQEINKAQLTLTTAAPTPARALVTR